jgi:hypothetical protein
MTLVFSQAAPFTGPAYDYLRADDALPSYPEIAGERDPLCRVKLFQPFSSWTYYVCAATRYDGIDGPVLTATASRRSGATATSSADHGLAEIAALRVHGPAARARPALPAAAAVRGRGARRPPRLRALNQERPARLRATGAPRAEGRRTHATGHGQAGRHRAPSTRRAASSRRSSAPSATASWR